MGGFRYTLFAILLLASLIHGAKRKVACKNCLKNKASHHNGNRLIASPINLLNPDRYEFFTLDDKGKVVKRIMTFNEIQSIVAGSDVSELKLFTNGNNNERIVSSVVSNVRNVLNNELNLMNGHEGADFVTTELSISDVISVQREPITSSTASSSDQMNGGPSERPTTELPTTTQTEQLSERPVQSILQQSELITLLKSTVKHEVLNTTDRTTEITTKPTTTSSSTERTTRSTTAQPPASTTERATTVRTTQRATEGSPPKSTIVVSSSRPALKTTEQTTEHSSTRPMTEKPETTRTTTRQTERPTEKFATQHVKSTVATTNMRPTEIEVAKLTEQPMLLPVESSTQPTHERSTENYIEQLVTESSEKSVEESIYPIEASVEISSEESTEFTITKAPQISSQFSTKIENESDSDYSTESSSSSITTASLISGFLASTSLHPLKKPVSADGPSMPETTESDNIAGTLKDLISTSTNFEEDSSETFKTPTESDTLLTDAIAQYITNIQREPVVTTVFEEVSDDNVESSITTVAVHPEETTLGMTASYEALPTTIVLEGENDAHLEDSTEASSEESESTQSSTWELPEVEVTTVENLKSKPSQMDIVPSDAQQALHKIIESLQFPDDGADSKEANMKFAHSTMIPEMDVGPLTYDTDAQNSINAIIQSLGQGSLFSDENSIMSVTTDETTRFTTVTETTPNTTPSTTTTTTTTTTASTTTSSEKTTTPRPSSTAHTTFSVPVSKTASATESSETDLSSNINYNTNIMDTIEKFLSKFAGLPNPETYSVNMTKMDVLSDFPSEINMTDYVDRTATVASVLKFPHTKPVQLDRPLTNRNNVQSEPEDPELLEDTPVESMLNETVASFMKLGEMLSMGSIINTSPEPTQVQVELKTVVDEEETELLRFLSICGNLGTNMYRDLTDTSLLHSRSLVYSPFATITTLSMLFLGTRGTTAESINGVIGLDEMTSFNPHLFFKSIADDLQPRYRRKAVPTFEGSSFSRTLLSDRTQGGLQRFFKARVQEIYSAVAEPIDFQQKDEILRHMSGDFPREYVDTLKQLRAPLISISRNRYRHECNSATLYGVMNFQRSSAEAISTTALPSVTFRSGFSTGFSKSLNATIVSLPGSTSNISVFFLKPAEISGHSQGGLEALEAHVHSQSISNVLKLFPDETVRTAYAEVQLPHFTQTSMYNMSRSIRQLGLENLFQSNTANFNGLQDSTISNMYLSETIQTDAFALCGRDELVTKSSIAFHSFSTNLPKHASVAAIGNSTAKRTSRKNRSVADVGRANDRMLVFDTPFLYLVRHNPTGLFLYVGRFLG
ncbi:serine-rich adhesin for platelets-like [Anopheles bellator]|uniref:serine-rich adhesin for platelets-like n=1 Tax=Anopheles bellator TaxID=139047 RepID=UPI00264747BA|nr:serine-rich adhesin for platelets-like [Anopheles bellator]